MSLYFEVKQSLQSGVDARRLSPSALAGLPRNAIEQLELLVDNQLAVVGDLFRVSGESTGQRIVFQGDCRMLDCLAAEQCNGEIIVEGNVGVLCGRGMRGGRLVIEGNAGDYLGSTMRGGRIVVTGSAGNRVGAPLRGERTGMRGGEIVIAGNAGGEVAMNLRRGWILVAGSVGAGCGHGMVAGTVVCDRIRSERLAVRMRRGSILCREIVSPENTSESDFDLGVTAGIFGLPYPAHEVALRLMSRFIALCGEEFKGDLGEPIRRIASIAPEGWLRRQGDLSVDGMGEILIPNSQGACV